MELPFQTETPLEALICADPAWQMGANWGEPRPGHPEGLVMYHIAEVLANVDRCATSAEERANLRLIALVHDSLKYQVNPDKQKTGENHHAMLARRFAEHFLEDQVLLDIIELHDEAYNSWRLGAHKHNWEKAEERAGRCVTRLGAAVPLYVQFFRCDNATGSKSVASLEWFEAFVQQRGYHLQARPALPRLEDRPSGENSQPVLKSRKRSLWLNAKFVPFMMIARLLSIKRIVKR